MKPALGPTERSGALSEVGNYLVAPLWEQQEEEGDESVGAQQVAGPLVMGIFWFCYQWDLTNSIIPIKCSILENTHICSTVENNKCNKEFDHSEAVKVSIHFVCPMFKPLCSSDGRRIIYPR